jgi:hypothetical protein
MTSGVISGSIGSLMKSAGFRGGGLVLAPLPGSTMRIDRA